jgi:hypothetical protein
MEGLIMADIGIGLAAVLIAIAAAHIAEEARAGFTRFLNTEWFAGNATCPVGRFKGLYFDKIGLLAGIVLASLLAVWVDGSWIWIPIGILIADSLQHVVFSASTRRYTPGLATCVLYLAFLVYFFGRLGLPDGWPGWLALVVGAAVIAGNYAMAAAKVRKGECSEVAA